MKGSYSTQHKEVKKKRRVVLTTLALLRPSKRVKAFQHASKKKRTERRWESGELSRGQRGRGSSHEHSRIVDGGFVKGVAASIPGGGIRKGVQFVFRYELKGVLRWSGEPKEKRNLESKVKGK